MCSRILRFCLGIKIKSLLVLEHNDATIYAMRLLYTKKKFILYVNSTQTSQYANHITTTTAKVFKHHTTEYKQGSYSFCFVSKSTSLSCSSSSATAIGHKTHQHNNNQCQPKPTHDTRTQTYRPVPYGDCCLFVPIALMHVPIVWIIHPNQVYLLYHKWKESHAMAYTFHVLPDHQYRPHIY